MVDIEKRITKTEITLEMAKQGVEEKKRALQEAQDECEEVQHKLANLCKRLAYVAAQKVQETTEHEGAQALRQAMASIQNMSCGRICEEALLSPKHLQRLLPAEDDADDGDDEALSRTSSCISADSNDTLAEIDEDSNDSFNESDYEPEEVEGVKENRRRLATIA